MKLQYEKLIKGYVDTVFNIWRMGKDANLNYEETKKRLDDINRILNGHDKFITLEKGDTVCFVLQMPGL